MRHFTYSRSNQPDRCSLKMFSMEMFSTQQDPNANNSCVDVEILLHFALIVDKRNVWWPRTSVCLSVCTCVRMSLAAFPHYCTHPDVSLGMVGGAPSCAPVGEFAKTGALARLLWQHTHLWWICCVLCSYSWRGLMNWMNKYCEMSARTSVLAVWLIYL